MQVDLHQLNKSFGKSRAVAELSVSIPPSSIVAVLGENGAGKSTLLRLLAGLLAPDSGCVEYDGVAFDREKLELRKRIHFTPDMPLLFPEDTVARNIATFAALYGKETTGREAYLTEWLQETGAARLMRRTAGLLSRGQQWKAGMACVAAIEPELWLVDEPFASGMDAVGLGAFKRLCRHLSGQGASILYTTQLVRMAAEFSDRILVIRDGELVLWEESETVRRFMDQDPDAEEKILLGQLKPA